MYWLWLICIALLLLHCQQSTQAAPLAAEAYRSAVTRESQARFGIPAPAPLIAAQIQQESGWNPNARSKVGAIGLMQFMPSTAQWAATQNAWGGVNATDPLWSIRAGVWYDRWLYDRVTADTSCDRWHFVFSGYNGGLGYVYKRQHRSAQPGSYAATGIINPGIHPDNQRENQNYAPRILFVHQPQFKLWGATECLK